MAHRSWAVGVALLLVGTPAWAQTQPPSSFSADAAVGVAREFNAMRYSDQQWNGQAATEDTVRSIWLAVQGQYAGSRHRLEVDARWSAHRYHLQPDLDHDEHLAKALWQWQPLRALWTEWSVGSSRRRALPSWGASRPTPSWETRDDFMALLRWGAADRQHVDLTASARDVGDGTGASAASAYTQESVAAVWRSAPRQVLQGSWGLRGIRGRQTEIAGPGQARERYRGEDLQAQGSWWISGVEGAQRLEAAWGYGRVRYERQEERSLQGHFGRLTWRWQPQRYWQAQLFAEQVPGFDVQASPAVLGEASGELAVATRWTRTTRAQLMWHASASLTAQAQLAEVSRSRATAGGDALWWTEYGHLAALGAQWRANGRDSQPYLRCDYTRQRWSIPAQPSNRMRWHSLGCRLGIALK